MAEMSCPSCGNPVQVADADAERPARCPHCGQALPAPPASRAADAGQIPTALPVAQPSPSGALDRRLRERIQRRRRQKAAEEPVIDPEAAERARRKKVLYAREGVPLEPPTPAAIRQPRPPPWNPFGAAGLPVHACRFRVRVRPWVFRGFGRDNWIWRAPDELIVDAEGLRLRRAGGKRGHRFAIDWNDLSELKDALREKQRFSAAFIDEHGVAPLRVTIKDGPVDTLIRLFEACPSAVRGWRCPVCAGEVSSGVCTLCGRKLAREYRRRGLRRVGIGLALLGMAAVGVLVRLLTGAYFFFGVAICFSISGFGVFFSGLWAAVFGTRSWQDVPGAGRK
jgi:hypothetical protein